MIQRIQSLLLLLAAMAGIFLYFLPLYKLEPGITATDVTVYMFFVGGVRQINGVVSTDFISYWPQFLLNLLIIGVTLWTIFLFKKRKQQLLLCRIIVILQFSLIFLFGYNTLSLRTIVGPAHHLNPCWAVILILIEMVLVIMSSRFIRKDELLVRSADRLR